MKQFFLLSFMMCLLLVLPGCLCKKECHSEPKRHCEKKPKKQCEPKKHCEKKPKKQCRKKCNGEMDDAMYNDTMYVQEEPLYIEEDMMMQE